jgi:hypothetical protein
VSSISEFISNLKKAVKNEMNSKLNEFQSNEKQIEEGLTTFDLSVTSVIKALTEEQFTVSTKILLTVYAKVCSRAPHAYLAWI